MALPDIRCGKPQRQGERAPKKQNLADTMQGKVFPAGEGIVKGDVEETIRSVSRLAREGM